MTQSEVTILRVHKSTRNRLRKLAVARRESYDEIINRLLEEGNNFENRSELQRKKQKLLKMGISKELVDLVGILPKSEIKEDKRLIGEAIRRWVSEKEG